MLTSCFVKAMEHFLHSSSTNAMIIFILKKSKGPFERVCHQLTFLQFKDKIKILLFSNKYHYNI